MDFPTLRTLGNRVSNIATELVKPLIPVSIEVFAIPFEDGDRRILAVQVEEGVAKPYKDRNGTIWLKQGCDKRKLTENAEQLRLFQQSGLLFIDSQAQAGQHMYEMARHTLYERAVAFIGLGITAMNGEI